MEYENEETILEQLGSVYGLNDSIKTIVKYAQFAKLRSENNISKDIADFNVCIHCNNDYTDIKAIIEILCDILKANNITSKDYHELTQAEMRHACFRNFEEDVIVIDTNKLDATSRFIYELKFEIANSNKIYFLIFNDNIVFRGKKEDEGCLVKGFSWFLEIGDLTVEERKQYINQMLKKNNIKLAPSCRYASILANIDIQLDDEILDIILKCKTNNITTITNKTLEKFKKYEYITTSNKSALQELNAMIGLDNVKQQIKQIVNYVKINNIRGHPPTLHMCFLGDSGTGKTDVARLVGKIFAEEGVLQSDKFVEVSRVDLVGAYVGQTAIKTQKVIQSALGGVLFIDEAYSLLSSDNYSSECISTLIKAMEDYKDNLCVILAGYKQDMQNLIDANPGFRSRIPFTINFGNYSADELYEIFKKMCKDNNYNLNKDIKPLLVDNFKQAKRDENFGNGRYVRNLLDKARFAHADRIVLNSNEDINTLTKADIITAIEQIKSQKTQNTHKRIIGFGGDCRYETVNQEVL